MANSKKSQAFSTDIIIVVVIVLFAALFLVITQINNIESGTGVEQRYEQASLQADLVVDKLKEQEILDPENNLDVEKLMTLDEEQLKQELNIKNDFAIVFEKDGKLVKVDPENDINCVGSNNIIVNGEVCK